MIWAKRLTGFLIRLTFYPFNVLRKVFKRFVVRLRECSIRLSGISGKTLKPVSSIQVVEESYIKYLRVYDFNRLIKDCMFTVHIHWFESTTDRFALQLYGEFNWKYAQIGLFCSLWFLNFIQWSSCKQLTNWEDWILRVLKIIETDVSRTIQIQRCPRWNSKHSFVRLGSLFEHKWTCSFIKLTKRLVRCLNAPWKLLYGDLPFVCDNLKAHLQSVVLRADWMMLKNASNQRGVNSVTVTTWLTKYRLRMFELFC